MMGERKPALRFKGFEGEWGRWQISNIADKTYGGGTPSTSNEEFWVGDIPWIQSSDLKEGKVFDVIPHKFLSKNAFNSSATKLIPENSIAIITRVGVGKLALIPFSYATSQDFLSLSNTNKNEWFTVYALYNKLKSEVNLVQGTSIKGITKQDFLSKEISVPCYDEEAIKIGNYFKQLDALITQQQRKYESLLNVKKSMLEKMFPKDGADVPEIRFKGFEGKWEQRKFTDITFPAGEKNKVNLPLESYSISNDRGFIPQNELFENGGTMRDADKSMYYIVSQNSFAYNPARINVGSIGYYDLPENVIVSSLYEVFKTTEDIDDRFLWYWFKSETFQRMIEQYQEGGVRLYFYYDKLCMCSITLPSFKEQNLIGVTFDKLDTLLTQHQKKLDHLKHIKSALLEKMFVPETA